MKEVERIKLIAESLELLTRCVYYLMINKGDYNYPLLDELKVNVLRLLKDIENED